MNMNSNMSSQNNQSYNQSYYTTTTPQYTTTTPQYNRNVYDRNVTNPSSINEYENNNISYLFRFDTLFPRTEQNTTELSFNIITVDENNTELLDISNDNTDIFNVLNYRDIENPINDICPITRDRFFSEQNVFMIKKCKHIFNKSALNIWIANNNTCPTCRTNIR